MLRIAAALGAGLLFGLGLTVSAMIDPAKVLGFLDVAGRWDPSLAFVMAAAIPVAAAGFFIARRFAKPLCEPAFMPPIKTRVDLKLCLGAMLFGSGWGLVGYCPGPAFASLGFGDWHTALFVGAMLLGMISIRKIFI